MKNNFLYRFKSKVKLQVNGKHVERFLHKLAHNNIQLLNIEYSKECIWITVYQEDYPKILKLKSIYEIKVVGALGVIKIKKTLAVNKMLIISFIFGLSLLILLTNVIFKVEIVHSSSEVRNFLSHELKQLGIKEYTIKKGYKDIVEIKKQLILKYPEKIEWLEIEAVGVKYVVRIELRELPNQKEEQQQRHIIAKKDALIKKISAYEGMVVKEVNNYVKKGDIIISGNILLNDEIKGTVSANGEVFGEVWYTLTVEYPFTYYEERLTGKRKNVLSFKFLNKSFELFSSFKNKKITEKVLLKNDLLPIKLVLEKQEELIIIDQILTEEEAIEQAILLGQEKMKRELKENEYIVSNKILKANIREDRVIVDVFFVVYENITEYLEILLEDNKKLNSE